MINGEAVGSLRSPLALVPKFIRDEERLSEISEAIFRYIENKKEINIEWINEYNDICTYLRTLNFNK
jgi:hypothetical protein